ncbi:hypothetical protein VYU27_004576 [Nannochloropsis oceanica]
MPAPGPPSAATTVVNAGPPLQPPAFAPKTICVAGTYDGGIVGWEVQRRTQDATGPAKPAALKMTFAYTPHQGSVRSLAVPRGGAKAGLLLVSGGMDEHIRMYDLRKRAEAGELLHHKGTITALGFVGSSHLLSGSEDGMVCIWRVYDWSLLHILGGHKGAVTAVALHPSGKLALSTGRDRSLRLWDLVKGRCAYITKLEVVAESVKWSEDGEAYVLLLGDRRLEVRRTADNKPTAILVHPSRITALTFLPSSSSFSSSDSYEEEKEKEKGKKQQHVLTACDDLQLRIVDGASGAIISSIDVTPFCGRIKEAVLLHGSSSSGEGGREVVTASSNGKIVIWSINAAGTVVRPGPRTSLGECVRITCLAAYAVSEGGAGTEAAAAAAGLAQVNKRKKRKRKHKEEVKEGGEEVVLGHDRGMLRHEKMLKQHKKDRASKGSSGVSPFKQKEPMGEVGSSIRDDSSKIRGERARKPQQQQQQHQESSKSQAGL